MTPTGYAIIAGINAASLTVGGLYIRASIKASKNPEPEPESAPSAVASPRSFGNDFVAFLLIIFGGFAVVGGFFWLLYRILEAVF